MEIWDILIRDDARGATGLLPNFDEGASKQYPWSVCGKLGHASRVVGHDNESPRRRGKGERKGERSFERPLFHPDVKVRQGVLQNHKNAVVTFVEVPINEPG